MDDIDDADSSTVPDRKILTWGPFRKSGGRLPIYDREAALRPKSQTCCRFYIHCEITLEKSDPSTLDGTSKD